MKSIGKLIIFGITSLALIASAYAQSPREQLNQMVQQLQKSPTDNALREKIIKLATSIKPAPAIPEEANRAFVKGNVFQKEAKDASGYALAITAYRDALRSAPWWGDAYFNLAIALESAGKFDEAIASIRNYMASVSAGSTEAREARNKIYALEAKGEITNKQAAMQVEQQRPSVGGKWQDSLMDFQVIKSGEKFAIIPGSYFGRLGEWLPTGVEVNLQRVRFGGEQPACPSCGVFRFDLSLSASGNELIGTLYSADGTTRPAKFTRIP